MNKKKYMYLFAATMLMAACSSDEIISDDNSSNGQNTELSGFTGEITDNLMILESEGCDGEDAGETRSTISNGEFSKWGANDMVSISDGTLFYKYKTASATEGTSCTFEVVDNNSQFDHDLTGSESFYAFYPAAAVSGWNGAEVSAMVYTEQDYNENIDDGAMGAYMATKGEIGDNSHVSFSFKHCCSVVEVNLSSLGVTPKRVSLMSNDQVSLSGNLKYNIESNTIVVNNNDATGYSYSTQSNVVTLSNVAANATMVRFYILPVYISNGVTITVEDTDGNFYTKTTSTPVGNTADPGIAMKESNDKTTNVPVAKPYYKKFNFGAASTATRKGDWMATIPGNIWLHTLSIPGAHDAGTWKLTDSSIKEQMAYCQSLDIQAQLEAGVRAFDLRVPYKGLSSAPTTAKVNLYHGMVNCNVLFKDAMDYLVSFVKNHPTETVVVICNKENSTGNAAVSGTNTDETDYSEDANGCAWQASIREYLDGTYTDASTVDATITGSRKEYFITDVGQPMRLNNCRGKILFLTRNYYGTSQSATTPVYGGVIRDWGESTSFNATFHKDNAAAVCGVHVQDCYDVSDTSTKQGYVKDCLDASVADNNNIFYINFVSMAKSFNASLIFSPSSMYPKTNATTMNDAVATLLNSYTGKTGLMFYDFCGDATYNGNALQTAILNQNYKYVFKGRTRISSSSSNSTGATINGSEYADDSDVFAKPF